ncbi:MAG: glutamate-5-semialdehyde dehydrogenase [bacterium]
MSNDNIRNEVTKHALAALIAARKLNTLPTKIKNNILQAMADAILSKKDEIIFRNEIDIEAAAQAGLTQALIDRLTLNPKRIQGMVDSLQEIKSLSDPVGTVLEERTIAGGALLQKIKVPLGVIGIIYESRPNVTVEAAALCLKAGNTVVLRGGKEAVNSNLQLIHTIVPAAIAAGLPEGGIQFINITDRRSVHELTQLDKLVDLVIARGSEEMVKAVRQGSAVPVLGHGQGLCHTYIDKSAKLKMAVDIAYNAKVQRPGVCNAMETLLVHRDIAQKLLPELGEKLLSAGVELRGCEKTRAILTSITAAEENDWSTEYLDKILSIKIVETIDDALNHIAQYGSRHSEAIVAEDKQTAERFLMEVDAAAVFHNSSTRLHDGGIFGFGSEIGISTQKLHARGTMGIQELTTTKFVVRGSGQTR